MKVTHVGIKNAELAAQAGRPSLAPELLAAVGARYSRTDEGFEAILAKATKTDEGESNLIERLLSFADYGHRSILDLIPIPIFMDGISIFLAYKIFNECQCGDGQETSTRYCKFDIDGLIASSRLPTLDNYPGIGEHSLDALEWHNAMVTAFECYHEATALWTEHAERHPECVRIPESVTDQKVIDRMRRNYVFDRARYFIPAMAVTNMMLVQSAREWVRLVRYLKSSPFPEAWQLSDLIHKELELVAPHALKHSGYDPANHAEQMREIMLASESMETTDHPYTPNMGYVSHKANVQVELMLPYPFEWGKCDVEGSMQNHYNRYASVGSEIKRTGVRFTIPNIAFAEVRDLNRHRTGTRYTPMAPTGFYCAGDQLSRGGKSDLMRRLDDLYLKMKPIHHKSQELCRAADFTFHYYLTLGSEMSWEHSTQLNFAIYEFELRTGIGSHYRYAHFMRLCLQELYKQLPGLKGLVLEGEAEPE